MDGARLRIGRPAASLLLAALALAGSALVACGDDEDSSTPTTTAPDAGLRVEVHPPRVAPGGVVRAEVVNDTDQTFTYGAGYELERQIGEDFEQVKLPPRPIPEIGYVAKPGGTGPAVTVRIPQGATPGQYRVVIQRDVPDVGDLSGEFTVTSGS